MFTQCAHPVSRVSSQTFFSLQICLSLLRGVWGHLSLSPRYLSPLRMMKNFLCGKRVLHGQSASHLHSFGGTPCIDHHNPSYPMVVVLPSQSLSRWYTWTHEQDKGHLEWAQTKSLHLTLLPKVGWSGTCQKSNIDPLSLSLWDNTAFIWFFEAGCWVTALYQLADGSAVLKLSLDGILVGTSRVSTYHAWAPHWVPISCCGFYLSLTGRWLKHWFHGRCGLKTLQWQLWFFRKWCLFTMDVGVGRPTAKLHTIMDGGVYTNIMNHEGPERKGVRERTLQ